MKKRFLSLILATMMVFSLLSTTAFALETEDASKEVYSVTVDAELVSVSAYRLLCSPQEAGLCCLLR